MADLKPDFGVGGALDPGVVGRATRGAAETPATGGCIGEKAGCLRVRPGVVRPGVVRPGVVRPGVVRPAMRPGVRPVAALAPAPKVTVRRMAADATPATASAAAPDRRRRAERGGASTTIAPETSSAASSVTSVSVTSTSICWRDSQSEPVSSPVVSHPSGGVGGATGDIRFGVGASEGGSAASGEGSVGGSTAAMPCRVATRASSRSPTPSSRSCVAGVSEVVRTDFTLQMT